MKKNNPLISIIIANAPGRKKDLWRCLKSITKSNYENWEVVVVDNTAAPNYDRKIRKAYHDPRINIIKMPYNTGILGLNIGLLNASGDYLMIADDDSAVRPDTLTAIIDIFETLPKKVGVLSCAVFNKTNGFCQVDESSINTNNTFRSFCGASIFRAEIFKKLGYFEDRFFNWNYEEEFSFRLIESGYFIYFAGQEEIVVDHYPRSQQFRKEQVFLQARNKAWLNLKYFSWYLLPTIFCRDIVFICLQPFRRKTWKAVIYAGGGYLFGILTSLPFIIERNILSFPLQKKYIRAQIVEDITSLISNIHLLK